MRRRPNELAALLGGSFAVFLVPKWRGRRRAGGTVVGNGHGCDAKGWLAMPLNAHDASVVLFVRGLTSLKVLLTKGEAHAAAARIDPADLLGAELAPGMYNLAVQVHWAAEGARMAVDRLTGAAVAPGAADEAKSFEELHRRVDAALAHLAAVPSEATEAGLARTIEIAHRGASTRYAGIQFLQQFAVPNFFFHLAAAYAILRHKGVPLTKGDFLGPQG